MYQIDRIRAARALLEAKTPLKGDCGTRCAAACCQPDEDGQGGMLLFPGEAALYTPCPDFAVLTESPVSLSGQPLIFFTCKGSCPRDNRPLACRIFPLTPVSTDGGVSVTLDVRAWPVCPLMAHGMAGLSRDFIAAAQTAAAILWEDTENRAYIEWLTQQQAAFRGL